MADAVPTRAPSLMAVNYLFAPVAFVTVVLRCYVRIFMTKSFSSDDAAMVVALVRERGPLDAKRTFSFFLTDSLANRAAPVSRPSS